MSIERVLALASKDARLFFKNRFIALVTIGGIAVYIALYFIMPKTVDETLRFGLVASGLPVIRQEEQGIAVTTFDSEEKLRAAVLAGEVAAGLALHLDLGRITAYFLSDAPKELRDSIAVLAGELGRSLAGQPLPLEVTEEVLGPDLTGRQVPPRDRLRPMVAIMLLIVETIGLAGLIAEEVQLRTLTALRVTPVTTIELYMAKGLVGFTLAFVESVLYLAVVGGLSARPLLVLATLALGSLLVTALAFILGAVGRDFVSIFPWGIVALVALILPAFEVLFPGSLSDWIRVIPSWYLVDTLHRVAGYGAGWGDVFRNLLVLAGFVVALAAVGVLALRRKMT